MRSRALFCLFLFSQAIAHPSASVAQERLVAQPATAGVRDGGAMFSDEESRRAVASLRDVAEGTGVVAFVATVDDLEGASIEEAAVREARRSEIKGIFILVAKKERKIEVLASTQFRDAFTPQTLHMIRQAFAAGFLKGDFDGGLRDGVEAIKQAVADARKEGRLPRRDSAPAGNAPDAKRAGSTLVVRNQVKLTLEGARVIVEAAERKAVQMGLKSNIAVVDEGGHLLTFDRMTGSRPASGYTAITKAVSAATFRQPSGPIPAGAAEPSPILNIGLENAAAASGGKITALKGGVPVIVDGQVIGAAGSGGGTGEQDAEVVRAGIDAFLKQIEPTPTANDGGAVKD